MTDRWRKIPGYEHYAVSDQGDVASVQFRSEGITYFRLKPTDNGAGYRVVNLCKDGKPKTFRVHRLVMLAFHGPSEKEVNHKDGNKSNNKLENLEYLSRGDNVRHAQSHLGAKYGVRGEKHYRAKLTRDDIDSIIRMRTEGKSLRKIGQEFGVHFTTIQGIVNGDAWK